MPDFWKDQIFRNYLILIPFRKWKIFIDLSA